MRALVFKTNPLKALIEGEEYSVNYSGLEVMKAQEAVVHALSSVNGGKGANIDGIMELYKDFFIKSLGEDKLNEILPKQDDVDFSKYSQLFAFLSLVITEASIESSKRVMAEYSAERAEKRLV